MISEQNQNINKEIEIIKKNNQKSYEKTFITERKNTLERVKNGFEQAEKVNKFKDRKMKLLNY